MITLPNIGISARKVIEKEKVWLTNLQHFPTPVVPIYYIRDLPNIVCIRGDVYYMLPLLNKNQSIYAQSDKPFALWGIRILHYSSDGCEGNRYIRNHEL